MAEGNLTHLKTSINRDYRLGKIAKKAEEIQQSEISQTAIQDLVSWFLAQNGENPVDSLELNLSQEKHQTFAEINQNLEKAREILKPEIAILKQNLSNVEQIINRHYSSKFYALIHLT